MLKFRDEDGHMELLWVFGPAVLLAAIALFITYQFVDPAPPKRITIASGGPSGAYYAYAQRYRDILAREGVTLDILQTNGSLENIELLESAEAGVDVAFVQGGTGGHAAGDTLRSLASLYFEPLWVFLGESVAFRTADDLAGMRVSIGPEGSGTRALALELMRDAGYAEADVAVSDLTGKAAVDGLRDGRLDSLPVEPHASGGRHRPAQQSAPDRPDTPRPDRQPGRA
jgi:TRAP transporter TAXI family solute receptor